VFFGSPAYHVGIYAGNGMMWDSPHIGMAISKRHIWTSRVTFGRF
jgi:cell wall-associated NlpC family hydrolase